jgi:DNA-binding NarL/FixJ family response regulator
VTIQTRVREAEVKPQATEPVAHPSTLLRLLHIEDNPSDALLAQSYIRGVIPDVEFDSAARLSDVTVESAAAASCAILDLSLPDASGLEALHALRAMSADLPIIVLTGFDDLDVGLSAIRHGAEDYLIKNYADGDSLQRAIRYAIERRRLIAELASSVATGTAVPTTTARGTHQVAVDVNVATSVFTLRCRTCAWEVKSKSESMSSWGSLERMLLPHVAFGSTTQPSSTGPSTNAVVKQTIVSANSSSGDSLG